MKSAISVLLGFMGAIALVTAANAAEQIATTRTTTQTQDGMPSQTEQLMTQPLGVRRPEEALMQLQSSPYPLTKLNDIANSIQNNSAKPGSVAPDFIHTPDLGSNSDTNPIGFFQVPPPDPSVGINIKQ